MSFVRLLAKSIAHRFGWGCDTAYRPAQKRGPARLSVTILEDRLAPAVLTVNSLADGPISAASSQLTLREAVALVDTSGTAVDSFGNSLAAAKVSQIDTANPFGVNDIIQFAPNLLGSQQLIVLVDGSLLLDRNVMIRGLGASELAVSGNNQSTVFEVAAGAAVRISGLTVEAGASGVKSGGGIVNGGTLTLMDSIVTDNTAALGDGGGIYNTGRLKIVDSTVSDNLAINDGGLDNFGTLAMVDSTVSGNTAAGGNGGLANYGGRLALIDSSVSGNTALGAGGIGNYDNGSARLRNSIVSDNTADGAGGIFNTATLTLTDSIVADNLAIQGNGGGIINSGSLTLVDSTISGNSASNVGGLGNYDNGTTTLLNSTVSGNAASAGGISNLATSTGSRNAALFDASFFLAVPLAQTGSVVSGDAVCNENSGGETNTQTYPGGNLVAGSAEHKADVVVAGSSTAVVRHDSVDDSDALALIANALSNRPASDNIISTDSTGNVSAEATIQTTVDDVVCGRAEPKTEGNQAERFDILDREGSSLDQEPAVVQAEWTLGDLTGLVLLLPWLPYGGYLFEERSAHRQVALERKEESA